MNILYIYVYILYVFMYIMYIYVIQAASLWEKFGSLVIANPPSKSWVCSKMKFGHWWGPNLQYYPEWYSSALVLDDALAFLTSAYLLAQVQYCRSSVPLNPFPLLLTSLPGPVKTPQPLQGPLTTPTWPDVFLLRSLFWALCWFELFMPFSRLPVQPSN